MAREEQIKAEIIRRKQSWNHSDPQYVAGGKDVCDYLLGYIDSLSEAPISEDLEEAAKEAATWHSRVNGNQFFPNDYNKFIAGAEWAYEHPKNLWKDACGTDLPEIDREVIALLTNGKVVFAHRPPERWCGRNLDGEERVFYPKTYDEGEWNQPDVKWWLDIELPKMEE